MPFGLFGEYGESSLLRSVVESHSNTWAGTPRPSGSSRSSGEPSDFDVRNLQERVEKLTLACAALWELLKERTEFSEDDLLAAIAALDLRDGKKDGKMTPTLKACPKCNRPMSPKHHRCLYCGAEDSGHSAFE